MTHAEPPLGDGPAQVLVVDDDPTNRRMLRDWLEAQGCEVEEAESGAEALRRALERPPDVVLLDVVMPGMGGREVCQRLTSHPATAHVPVLLITALTEPDERLEGVKAGAVDFLTKPVDLKELSFRVRNAVHAKRLVDALAAVRDELAAGNRALQERNEQLREANRVAEESRAAAYQASRYKSDFISKMSHELRTPLNAILGYSEMLQEQARELDSAHLLPDLDHIHTAGLHLLTLINDILDLSRIEAGKMTLHLETFDVAPLIRDAAATVQPLMDRNRNTLTVDCPADLGTMHADRTKVRQVLFNLLSNAAKFTEHGTVRLEVRPLGHLGAALEGGGGDEGLAMVVADTGIGMSPEQASRLFQAFSQADTAITAKYGGTGLGLMISRKFCQAMGGDILVESALGRGSTFTAILPRRVGAPGAAAGEGGP